MAVPTYHLSVNDPARADEVQALISKALPESEFRRAGSASWVIKADIPSTRELSEKILGPEKAKSLGHLVTRVQGFWGFGSKSLWEWLGE